MPGISGFFESREGQVIRRKEEMERRLKIVEGFLQERKAITPICHSLRASHK